MYLQITERCNMKCRHCCMSAGKKGADMALDTVKATLAHGADEYITIGGGEPTLHPSFYEILCLTIAACAEGGAHVITNGKIKDRALLLARMAKGGTIGAELSVDGYHEKIDPEVYAAFKTPPRTGYGETRDRDGRGIRTVTRILARGRGKKIFGAEDECACNDTFVDPKGDVYLCGCKNVKLGNVFDGWEMPEEYPDGTGFDSGTCGHEYLKRVKKCETEKAFEALKETADGCRL